MTLFIAATVVLVVLHSDFVSTGCPSVYTSCNGSTCNSCEQSYYLECKTCLSCPDFCLSCTNYSNCTKCKANKWGTGALQCLKDCCKDCLNGDCYDVTEYCLNCEHGKYGFLCQHNCSDCKNEHCGLFRCVEGCKFGYFEYQTTYDYLCHKCPINCKQCGNGNVCRICNNGFYFNKYYHNGNTYVNCAKCFNENYCSNFCNIQGCKLCQLVDNKPKCSDCSEGEIFNGNSCEQITIKCSQGCSSNCDSNSICFGNCNNGWTGERCAEECNEKCLIYSKTDRNICIQCNGNFYTNDCSLACSKSCEIEEGKGTCTLDDGYCLNGCERNYWGDTCNKSCPEGCQDRDCDRRNGTCTGVCKDGYTGEKCGPTNTINKKEITVTTTLTTTKTTISQNNAVEDQIFIIGFFSGIGCFVIIVAFAALLYFIRRRYLANKAAQNNSTNVEIPTFIESANNYESLSHNRTRDTVYSDLGTTE